MGWTFTHRARGISNTDWFADYMGDGRDGGRGLVETAQSGSVVFGAYRTHQGDIIAAVILVKWVPNDWYNFGWKAMTETEGPIDADCPDKVWNMLTPLDELKSDPGYAAAWRDRARVQRQASRIGRKVKGATYFFNDKAHASLRPYLTCTDGRRNLFVDPWGHRVKVHGGWLHPDYMIRVEYPDGSKWVGNTP